VLELCPGGELFHQIVRLTYFSEDLARHVIVQVAKAIEYLHETSGVVHRYGSSLAPCVTLQIVANVIEAISSRKTFSSILYRLFRVKTRSLNSPAMKIR